MLVCLIFVCYGSKFLFKHKVAGNDPKSSQSFSVVLFFRNYIIRVAVLVVSFFYTKRVLF